MQSSRGGLVEALQQELGVKKKKKLHQVKVSPFARVNKEVDKKSKDLRLERVGMKAAINLLSATRRLSWKGCD